MNGVGLIKAEVQSGTRVLLPGVSLTIMLMMWLSVVLMPLTPGIGSMMAQGGSPFSFSGSLGLHYDAYTFSEQNFANFRARHPSGLGRFNAEATLSAGRHFRMPVSILITTGQNTYNLPSKPDERFIDYIQNPRNNISLNPTWRWFSAFLGTQTPAYSELTTGDIAMFGLGFELTPGHFLFTLNYGKSQIGVDYDPLRNIAGAYEQRMLTGRIGYGPADGTHFVLQMARTFEDENSLDSAPPAVRPSETLNLSPLLQVRLAPSLLLRTETAGSAYTNDRRGPAAPYDNPLLDLLNGLMDVNASTNADWAHVSSLEWRDETFNLGGEFRYIGAGYRAAGYRVMESDLADYKINAGYRMPGNRLQLSGSVGLRHGNLSETSGDRTTRTILNVNSYGQISEQFSVGANYANFGFRNDVALDTLRVEMINHTVSLAPTWQKRAGDLTHVVSGAVSWSRFDDFNLFTGSFQNTTSFSLSSNYQIAMGRIPLSMGVMGMYLENDTPVTGIRILQTGLNARYRLLDRRLTPSLMVTWTNISRDDFSADNRYRLTLRTSYRVHRTTDLRASWNLSHYRYGSARPDAAVTENRFQISLQTRF